LFAERDAITDADAEPVGGEREAVERPEHDTDGGIARPLGHEVAGAQRAGDRVRNRQRADRDELPLARRALHRAEILLLERRRLEAGADCAAQRHAVGGVEACGRAPRRLAAEIVIMVIAYRTAEQQ